MSYSIVICDRDQIFAERLDQRIRQIVQKYKETCRIERYSDSFELDEEKSRYPADIYFLDIDIGVDGIGLAERLKKRDSDTNIIFVSNRDDLVFQAIHCQPFRYIRKRKLEEELEEALHAVFVKIDREEKKFELSLKEGQIQILSRQMIYIESDKHYLNIHSMGSQHKVRGKLSDYELQLKKCGFVRTHVSYLVNMRYIGKVGMTELELIDGCVLPISRTKQGEVKQLYREYMQKYVYGSDLVV